MRTKLLMLGRSVAKVSCKAIREHKIRIYKTEKLAYINGEVWDVWANVCWNDDKLIGKLFDEADEVHNLDKCCVREGKYEAIPVDLVYCM